MIKSKFFLIYLLKFLKIRYSIIFLNNFVYLSSQIIDSVQPVTCNISVVIRMWSTQMQSHTSQQLTDKNQQNLNAQQQQRTLGMTSAITLAGPKPIDVLRTKELEDALKPYNVMETEQELNHRSVFIKNVLTPF